jgi:hypothetical protein
LQSLRWTPTLAGIFKNPVFVFLCSRFRVNLDSPQVRLSLNRLNFITNRAVQNIAQMGCWISGQQQGFMSLSASHTAVIQDATSFPHLLYRQRTPSGDARSVGSRSRTTSTGVTSVDL